MMEFSYRRCTSTPCAFIERFKRLREEPKQNNRAHNCHNCVTNDNNDSTIAYNTAPMIIMLLLLYLLSRLLVNGTVTNIPIGAASRAVPSCASLMFNWCCMAGMRHAQVEL